MVQPSSKRLVTETNGDARYAFGEDGAVLTAPRAPKPTNSALISGFQAGHGFTNYNSTSASVSDDTTDYLLGTQSLKVVSKTDNSAATVQKTGQNIDATGKMLRLLVKIDDLTNITELIVYAGNDTLTSYYQWTLADADPTFAQHFMKAGEWVWMTLGFQDAAVIGTPNRAGITLTRLRARASTGNSITVRYNGLALVDEPSAFPNGVVSFTYDDSYLSHYTEGRKALDKYGWAGTAYTICDLVDSGSGWMTTQNLKDMQRTGWDIAAHAYTMADHQTGFHNMNDADLAADLRNMRRWLTSRGFVAGDHLAYPQGGFTPATIAVARKYFASARTVNRRTLETLRPADALRLRSFSVSMNDAVATVQAKIDAAKANKGWLILTFHELTATPTVANHYSIANHQAIVDYCASVGIAVMPVSDVNARLAQVDAVRSTTGGTSATAALAAATHAALGNSSTSVNAIRRVEASAGITTVAGRADVVCFSPVVDLTITKLSAMTSGTAWTGQTLARIGLYTIDGSGNATLVAATASDATLFAAANTVYQRALSTTGGLPASYTLAAGQRYAIAVIGVGQTAGTLRGATASSVLAQRVPSLGGTLGTGLTDLPTSGAITVTGNYPWAEAAA